MDTLLVSRNQVKCLKGTYGFTAGKRTWSSPAVWMSIRWRSKRFLMKWSGSTKVQLLVSEAWENYKFPKFLGVPHPDFGEAVVAVCVLNDPLVAANGTASALEQTISERLRWENFFHLKVFPHFLHLRLLLMMFIQLSYKLTNRKTIKTAKRELDLSRDRTKSVTITQVWHEKNYPTENDGSFWILICMDCSFLSCMRVIEDLN